VKANFKILLTLGLIALVTGGVFASIKYSQRGIVDVQTGRVVRQDLVATVTASGEIKPKNYINLGANTLGPAPITEIMVKEGDRVHKGEVVGSRFEIAARRRHHRAGHLGEDQSRAGSYQSQL
jgi:HlyD family secretion protein